MRTYSKSSEELWLDEWSHPLEKVVHVKDPSAFLKSLESPVDDTEQVPSMGSICQRLQTYQGRYFCGFVGIAFTA
ncbi:hypothetical protein B0H11DRAFT_1110421 [Mycena galericulata]|nr:hypothetical protein B0H11DRAFT_1110421 [Mycena galericulata]